MSWIHDLYLTYENCQNMVGYSNEVNTRPLLPICHITARAHIEIVINGDGKFLRAKVITDLDNSTTIIPSTEGSASRSGIHPVNHPLCDKLQYIAGDFITYGGNVTSGFSKDPGAPFRNYVRSLTKWCNSKFSHPKIKAILSYVNNKNLIKDLISSQVIYIDNNEKFVKNDDFSRETNTKDIFSVVSIQENAFVRWIVEIPGENESRVWKDKSLWESWINYYLSNKKSKSLCYVFGENKVITTNHPKYIRREGDGAKLISANDNDGFTFRGRFENDQEACGVSLEASHKAHYALSWLISRQGFSRGDLAIVAWANSGKPMPQPTDDAFSILFGGEQVLESDFVDTAQELALKLKKRIAGFGKDIGETNHVYVIAVDSATTGRLAICYYRKLKGSDFLQRIDNWHETCAWLHTYRNIEFIDPNSGKRETKYIPFIGAPAPNDIAEIVYGSRIDDKLRKSTIERILPCILEGQPIPRDLVESALRRTSNRIGKKEWEWNKTLSIACALFKKYKRKENYHMALELDRTTRDYLYGRLLALAESLEEWALNKANENRETNAARLMQRFSERPFTTWRTIELALLPYKARLGGISKKRQRIIDDVIAMFNYDDFVSDKKLSVEFLLGYHCQREYLRNYVEENKETDPDLETN